MCEKEKQQFILALLADLIYGTDCPFAVIVGKVLVRISPPVNIQHAKDRRSITAKGSRDITCDVGEVYVSHRITLSRHCVRLLDYNLSSINKG
jgi:hypothetical protein